MNIEYAEYYSEASDSVARFADTLADCHFDEVNQAVEVFALQALAICRDNCRAISILLRQGLFAEPIIISRSLFELFFAIHWILEATTTEEKLERAYQLEATPYHEFAKEVRLIEENFRGPDPRWSAQKVKEFRAVIEKIKNDSPFLLHMSKRNQLEFKKAPALADRMTPNERLRFYQVYRFASFFTHPTPSLKQVYLKQTGTDQSIPDLMQEPLKQTLAYTMFFVQNVCWHCVRIFESYNSHQAPVRDECHTNLRILLDKTNKGYFRTGPPAPSPS